MAAGQLRQALLPPPLHVAQLLSQASQPSPALLGKNFAGQMARHAPLCKYGAFDGHAVHSELLGPLQVAHEPSQACVAESAERT